MNVHVTRRIVYLVVALAVIIPMLFLKGKPVAVSEPVLKAFQAIDSLKEGSYVLISTDYGPGTMPEVNPMVYAVVRHAFRKNLKVVYLSVVDALGLALGDQVIKNVAQEYGKEYGKDFVNLGFKPGAEAVIVSLGKEIRDIFPEDVRGVPLDSMEITKNIHNLKDFAIVVDFASGYGITAWIRYAQARFGVFLVGCVTAVMGPENYPYLDSGQLKGLVAGLKGAAEYETLLGKPGIATRGMPAQSAVHILIIALIVIGNIIYLVEKRKKK